MKRVRVAKSVIRNKSGRYLVLRCSEWPERPDRSLKPDLAGGEVEKGEDMETGITREILEEAGLVVDRKDLELAYSASFIGKYEENEAIIRFLYFIQLSDDPDVTLSWEHDKHWWVTADELVSMDWKPYYREAFEFMRTSGLIT